MRLSASKIDLARRCLWPFRPDAGPRNRGTFEANEGTIEHGHIEETLKTAGADASPKSPTHARWLDEWWRENSVYPWHPEQPVALDPMTGETRLGPEAWDRRDYAWAPWRFLVGTADAWAVVRVDGKTIVRVCDWKTGHAGHVKDPRTAGQMLFLGLAYERHLRHLGTPVDAVSLEYVLVNESRLWVESALVKRPELSIFQSELVDLMREIDADPQPVRGHWCKSMWCDYHGRCPATAGALEALAPAPAFPVVLSPAEFVSDEHAAWQYRLVQAAAKRLEEATAAVKERAWEKPIALEDGRVYGPRERTRESVKIDTPGALDVLNEQLGDRACQAVETKISSSKSAIEDVCRVVAKERGTTIKAVKASVFAALHAVGAIRVSTYQELDEYEPEIKRGLAGGEP